MFFYAAVWAVTINNFFHRWGTFSCFSCFQTLTLFRWWCWVFGSCAQWGPKGLPYIIHYALAHQTGCKAALLWSHSKKALVISLPLGGQLLEQKRQKLQSTPPCSDCSEVERKKKTERERKWGGGSTRGLFLGMAGHWFYSWVVVCFVFGTGCPEPRWMGSLSAQLVFRDLQFHHAEFDKALKMFFFDGMFLITSPQVLH